MAGKQELWVAGSRFYFKRDPIDGVVQEIIDLGTIETANPANEITKIEAEDAWGGTVKTIDETVTKITETYELVCRNLANTNLAIFGLAAPPVDFTQTQTEKTVQHYTHPDALLQIHDSDADSTWLYQLDAVAAVVSETGTFSTVAVTAVNAATRTITVSADLTGDLSPGDVVALQSAGLANKANSRSYTVASVTTTTVVVVEAMAANETSISGTLMYTDGADTATIYEQGVDWELESLETGKIRVLSGGAISTAGNKRVVFTTGALSGKRIWYPQSAKGEVQGDGQIWWSRGDFSRMTVRQARVSLTPSGSAIQQGQYATITLNARVLSEITELHPAGRAIHTKGTVPAYTE